MTCVPKWNLGTRPKDSGGTELVRYEYDGQTRRIQEHRGSTNELYYSNQWQVIQEGYGERDQITYVWSPVYVDAMVARDGDGNLVPSGRLYVTHDANFNVTAITDSSGNVVERYTYDPFGTAIVRDAAWTVTTPAYGWQYLHQGGRLNAESGLYSFRYREYSPTLGRWVTMDPIGYKSNVINLYGYLENNFQFGYDPLGLYNPKTVWDKLPKDIQCCWLELEKRGWKLGTGATGIGGGSVLFNETRHVSFDVTDDVRIEQLAAERDVQWLHNDWAVDFGTQLIYVDAYWNSTATNVLKNIINILCKAGKASNYRHYDVSLLYKGNNHKNKGDWTYISLDEYSKEWFVMSEYATAAPNWSRLSIRQKRALITLWTLEWENKVNSMRTIASLSNLSAPSWTQVLNGVRKIYSAAGDVERAQIAKDEAEKIGK